MKRRSFLSLSVLVIILFTIMSLPLSVFAEDGESKPTLSLTEEERQCIEKHKTLRVGYVQDRIPVSFMDENGEFAGISRYIFDRVGELCGITFEYIPLPASGDVTYTYLLENKLDLVSSVEYNKENQTARGILLSDPYFSSRKVVVAREGLEFSYDANLSIAISSGSQTIKNVLGKAYPNFDIVEYQSTEQCFDAVRSGDADLLMLNQYIVEYWISKPIYENLKVIPVIGLEDQLCFSAVVAFGGGEGVPEDEGRTIIDIIDKAIAAISEDEIGSYTIQAVMEDQYEYTFSDFVYRYRMAVNVLMISAVVILVLAVLLFRQHVKSVEDEADAKVKGQFLSTMSHEIRTPLNGLIGLNYLMSQRLDDPDKMRDYLQQSTVTANYLLSLVNDMLDMSSLQAQDLGLYLSPVDLDLLIKTVGSVAGKAISDKKQRFNVKCSLGCPCVTGDAVRIQQVLLNLLDNARKFTPEGGTVDLTVRQEMLDDGRIKTLATVSDTGRGMSDEFQKHIFDTFARELETVSKGNQGTGLGLSISRRLAQLMGGDLTFESKKDVGSSFTFTFICEPADSAETGDGDAPLQPKRRMNTPPRILVAEDNELNGEIILELLHDDGIEADLAENGKIALSMFENSAPDTYDVILMDLLMPEMDGFEAARAIRALPRPDAKTVRIFACTANCSSEDRAKANASGMDDFIAKPLDVEDLLKKIRK